MPSSTISLNPSQFNPSRIRMNFRKSINHSFSNNNTNAPHAERANNGDMSCLIALLKSFAETNTEPETGQGFEHPIAFYDETERASSSSCLTYSKRSLEDEEDAARNKRRRRRGIIAAVALVLLLAVILAAVLGSKNKRQESKMSAAMAAEWERHCGGRRKQRALRTTQIQRALDTDDLLYHNIGCFRTQPSPDNRTITAETYPERVAACDAACPTNYFGLAGLKTDKKEFDDDEDTVTCYCYVDRPVARLSIGPCHRIDVLYDCGDDKNNKNDNGNDSSNSRRQEMEVFFDPHYREECSQETTATVRNFLVEEDDVPFGFDVVTAEFRPSPFELYKDECGTNVYKVQTEVSVVVHKNG